MKVGKYRFHFKYPPRPQVLLLYISARKSDFMWRVCDGITVEAYDLTERRLFLRPKYLFWLIRYAARMSRMAAMLAARISSQHISVLLAAENHDVATHGKISSNGQSISVTLFDEITSGIPHLRLISVQHGQELRRLNTNSQTKRWTLLCWGEWAAHNFRAFGRMEEKFVPVGPLIDGLYRQLRSESITKDNSICLISTVKGKQWWGQQPGERQLGYERLVQQLSRYAKENDLNVYVALTIDRDQFGPNDAESERNWFLERLGPNVLFTEPKVLSGDRNIRLDGRLEPRYIRERYATYFLSDRSEVTIGMASSALWESFGRGNKIYAVNHTSNPAYDFPVEGFWTKRHPSYEEFSESLSRLLRMSELEWKKISGSARDYLITYDSSDPPDRKINRFVRATIDQTSTN